MTTMTTIIVLDESKSMVVFPIDDIVNSVKLCVEKSKKNEVLVYKFSTTSFHPITIRSNDNVKELLSFSPNGFTKLNDTIYKAMHENKHKKNVRMIIITDGFDNRSEKTDKEIKRRCKRYEKRRSWNFHYIGSFSRDDIVKSNSERLGIRSSFRFTSNSGSLVKAVEAVC
jgi:uncharacterized protein with von Willebrand factor type A (vWA) domain